MICISLYGLYSLRFLETIELYRWPETYVVLVGPKSQSKGTLSHHTLRNSAKLLYLAYLHQSRDVDSPHVGFSTANSNMATRTAGVLTSHSRQAPFRQDIQQPILHTPSAITSRMMPHLQQLTTSKSPPGPHCGYEVVYMFLYLVCWSFS